MLTAEYNTASLKKLVLHYVGSKNNLDQLNISDKALELDETTMEQLQEGLLFKFKSIAEKYAFHHPSSLQYNEVYNFCQQLFDEPENIVTLSGEIARHLYNASTHPKVKGGEFYVAYFEGLPIESRMHRAIGFFKTENKSLFLEAHQEADGFALSMQEGVELSKIDKGCLIINRNEGEGYDVLLFDNQNRGEEAAYWKEGFLGVTPQKNEFHHTAHFLTLTKQFITGQLESEAGVTKTEQVDMLHKSINYFREKDAFDIDEFQTEVFAGNDDMINSFRQFGSRYVESNDYDIASNFDISHDAVKKQAKIYKSVLKLDKNFHIYIHGRTDLIERGTDEDGRKFYKIYYQDEA
ncbi:MAG: hypothetical protein JWP88_1829 [Flaviaesturariibacter sp.]|nr:hypothetical protein [Flaviaesturariibacter sp.]